MRVLSKKLLFITGGVVLAMSMAKGQSARISHVGPEEWVDSRYIDRPSISTDSKAQPHIVCDAGGNSTFLKYHKVNGKWSGGVFAVGSKGGRYNASRLYIGQIEVDGKDRAWISCKFGVKEYGSMMGQGIWLFRDVANNPNPPEQFFRHVNVYKGMGVVMTDAKYVDQGVVIGTHGNFNVLNQFGQTLDEGSINAGHGGEKVRGRIGSFAPRFGTKEDEGKAYADGIWHTAMNGSSAITASYQNSLRYKQGLGPTPWAGYSSYRIMGDDYHHPGIASDLSNPRVVYINTVFYGKMCINIWDGSKMLFDPWNLKVLDYNAAFEPRHAPAIAPAPGTDGGAFFFWTSEGMIKGCYVSKKGVQGKVMTITAGRTAATTTDRYGNIHMAYYNGGGMKYRKIFVSTLETVAPAGVVTGTRQPTFRWTNTRAASYTLDIKRDGAAYASPTVSGANTWIPPTEMPVGDYTWRVKEGAAGSSSQWSPVEPFVIPTATPVPQDPNTRLANGASVGFYWDCNDPDVNRIVVQLFKNGDLLDSKNVAVEKAPNYTWPTALQPGVYSWRAKSMRLLTDHNVSSPWSPELAFQVGVPGETALTVPAEGAQFNPGQQTIGFTWTGADGATAYKLKVLLNGALMDDPIANIADTNQGITRVYGPGYYTALVQPGNSEGAGPWSEAVTFEVLRGMRPGGNKTLTDPPAKLMWTRSRVATRYLAKLAVYNLKSGAYEVIREKWFDQVPAGTSPIWRPNFAWPAGAYRWTVTDYNGAKGLYTSVDYFQVDVPGRPELVEPRGAVNANSIDCLWSDPSDRAREFKVEVWKGNTRVRDSGWVLATDLLVNPDEYGRTFKSFEDGAYMWRVRGRNYKGTGPWREAMFTIDTTP